MAISCTRAYRGVANGLHQSRIAETVSFADPVRLTDTGEFMKEQPDETLPISKLRHIDRVCDRFEAALKAGKQVSVEDFLGDAKEPERSVLRKELEGVRAQFQKSAKKEGKPPGPPQDPGVAKFVRRLVESRLMTDDEVREFLDGLPEDEKPNSAEDLAKALYRQKRLTKFQTQAVFQGRTRGLVLGKYEVLEKIGSGGMGHVYKARHKRMRREVALKVLPTAVSRDKEAVLRFQREVMAAAQLDHPNIVAAYDADDDNGVYFLVMQHVEGLDLAKLVQTRGTLTVGKALSYIIQAAKGLEYAHAKGLIHRDIKPANLLLDRDGTVKILDMGLARFERELEEATAARSLTQDGQVMGTLDYMAPEQAVDTHTADARADVYSLGCTLYYLLTGESVYIGRTMASKFLAHREEPVPSLRTRRDDVPEGLDAVFGRMLAKRPEERQQSMTDLLVELESCCADRDEFAETVSLAAPVDPGTLGATAKESDSNDSALDAWLHARPDSAPTLFHLNPKKEKTVNRQRLINNLVAAGVAFVALLLTITLIVRTPKGTLIVEVNHPGATVEFDDGQITIITPDDKEPVRVRIAEGEHTLKVTKGGFETLTRSFTIGSKEEKTIRVRLDPEKPALARARSGNTTTGVTYPVRVGPIEFLGPPENLGPVVNGSNGESGPFISADGLTLLFQSDRPGGYGAADIWISVRSSPESEWGRPTNPGPPVNGSAEEGGPSLSSEGLVLLFNSGRPGGQGRQDIWLCERPSAEAAWTEAVNLGSLVNGRYDDWAPKVSSDGLAFIFAVMRGKDTGEHLWTCSRQPSRQDWSRPVDLGPEVNGSGWNGGPFLSLDGQLLLFHSPREGGQGAYDLWMRQRVSSSGSWSKPVNLGPSVNSPVSEHLPFLSSNGRFMLFSSDRPGGQGGADLYQVPVRLHERGEARREPGAFRGRPPQAIAPFGAAEAQKHQQAWADYLGMPVESENSIGMKMVLIPPGEFLMGSTAEEQARFLEEATAAKVQWFIDRIPGEGPQHPVRITKPFTLGRDEVTRGQFRRFVEETGYETEAERDGKGGRGIFDGKWVEDPQFVWSADPGFPQTDDHPVVNVSWSDATAFCQWLSKKQGVKYHLPTEAQWEYACRAGTTTFWCCGDSETTLREYAWSNANSGGKTRAAGQLKPNAWGLCDMHGNVLEWCADWYAEDYYAQSPPNDPSGPTARSLSEN